MSEKDQGESQQRMGGEAVQQQQGSGVQLPEAACRAIPLTVGVEATDEVLILLSAAGMNALPDPEGEPPRRAIVEVGADSAEEAAQKIRDLLGDVPIEPAG